MKVLILGNGFELDYGFETGYGDFIKSKPWKELYQEIPPTNRNNLATFLYNEAYRNHWFCLESSIAKYVDIKGRTKDYDSVDEDKNFFKALVKSLEYFLQDNYYSEIYDSLAHCFIAELINTNVFDKIFSFNYLPVYLHSIMGIKGDVDIENVHNTWGENILVGINEPVVPEYKFLCKAYSPYHQTTIKSVLCEATDVVIFGHSLNVIDSVYFIDFFKSLCKKDDSNRHRSLTIITKNDDSISDIKASIGEVGIVVTDLQSYCNVRFISTAKYEAGDYEEKAKVNGLINRIKQQLY